MGFFFQRINKDSVRAFEPLDTQIKIFATRRRAEWRSSLALV